MLFFITNIYLGENAKMTYPYIETLVNDHGAFYKEFFSQGVNIFHIGKQWEN